MDSEIHTEDLPATPGPAGVQLGDRQLNRTRLNSTLPDGTRPDCAVERALEVIGGKWTTLILRDLLGGTRRFGQLRAGLSGISPKTLTDRLRELEAGGVLVRRLYPEVPPRTEYTLTDKGRALGSVVAALADWGQEWT